MSALSKHIKDSRESSITITNIFSQLEQNRVISYQIARAGGHNWTIRVWRAEEQLKFALDYDRRAEYCSLSCRCALGIPNRNPSLDIWKRVEEDKLRPSEPLCVSIDLQKIKKDGFVQDDALVVNVKVRVDAVTNRKGVRFFNIWDPFEGSVTVNYSDKKEPHYASKKLMLFHCENFREEIEKGELLYVLPRIGVSRVDIKHFLQAIHGVQNISWFYPLSFRIGKYFGSKSYLRLSEPDASENSSRDLYFLPPFDPICERYLMCALKTRTGFSEIHEWLLFNEDVWTGDVMRAVASKYFSVDSKLELLLKTRSAQEMVNLMIGMDFTDSDSETMKKIVEKFFSFRH